MGFIEEENPVNPFDSLTLWSVECADRHLQLEQNLIQGCTTDQEDALISDLAGTIEEAVKTWFAEQRAAIEKQTQEREWEEGIRNRSQYQHLR